MAKACYKDLCIDAVDPDRMAEFWSAALGLRREPRPDPPYLLTGPTPQHSVWVNQVPEEKSVKLRLHIDVNVASVDELTDLGASVVDADSFAWTVLADPEGGELCAFVREGEITQRLYELVVGSVDPAQIASWWADVLGARLVVDEDHGYAWVEGIPGAPFGSIDFVPVPEPKTVKNRIHFDVDTPDVDALVAAGARVVRRLDDQISWHVLADPEGNEFCAFAD